jgi:glycosyltransferase involved in cell wall biosynthesis
MKIAVVVHGRFHAFHLAKALIDCGADVTVFTNYPKWAVKKFNIAPENVRSLWPHGVLSRLTMSMNDWLGTPFPEAKLHHWFGDWAARELAREKWDAIHCWSGVAEESLLLNRSKESLNAMARCSAHILTQSRLLKEEEQRTGVRMTRPSEWIIAQELREYQLCDVIVVLSSFAYDSFVAQGVAREKLCLLPLGVNVADFRPSTEIVEERCRRILSGQPLRVINVGAVSLRKGFWDTEQIVRRAGKNFEFRFVGPMTPECRGLAKRMKGMAEFVPKQPQNELWKWYAWGDMFIFPTIEEGFATVLAQAQAAALPILATVNSGGPNIVEEGKTGWILPIRDPQAFLDRLEWCASHRKELVEMVHYSHAQFRPRVWNDMAREFMNMVQARRDQARDKRLHGDPTRD